MSNLPVKTDEDFVAEFEKMNLDELRDKQFLVSVSRGDRNKHDFLTSQIRGPYTFEEMCEEVGVMYMNEQHHAKVVLCNKDRNAKVKTLDENTVDYIEAHYGDIITDSLLAGVFDEVPDYTCKAGIVEFNDDKPTETPAGQTNAKKEEKEEDEDL